MPLALVRTIHYTLVLHGRPRCRVPAQRPDGYAPPVTPRPLWSQRLAAPHCVRDRLNGKSQKKKKKKKPRSTNHRMYRSQQRHAAPHGVCCQAAHSTRGWDRKLGRRPTHPRPPSLDTRPRPTHPPGAGSALPEATASPKARRRQSPAARDRPPRPGESGPTSNEDGRSHTTPHRTAPHRTAPQQLLLLLMLVLVLVLFGCCCCSGGGYCCWSCSCSIITPPPRPPPVTTTHKSTIMAPTRRGCMSSGSSVNNHYANGSSSSSSSSNHHNSSSRSSSDQNNRCISGATITTTMAAAAAGATTTTTTTTQNTRAANAELFRVLQQRSPVDQVIRLIRLPLQEHVKWDAEPEPVDHAAAAHDLQQLGLRLLATDVPCVVQHIGIGPRGIP